VQRVPMLKQYREQDGKFYFKLTDDSGAVLIQSRGFDNPKDAGAWVVRFKREGGKALESALDAIVALDADARAGAASALDALMQSETEREAAKQK
jgi:tryptophanyl-tRNA synthetase